MQACLLSLAFWVSFSRVSDYFHHPLDVAVGAAVGTLMVFYVGYSLYIYWYKNCVQSIFRLLWQCRSLALTQKTKRLAATIQNFKGFREYLETKLKTRLTGFPPQTEGLNKDRRRDPRPPWKTSPKSRSPTKCEMLLSILFKIRYFTFLWFPIFLKWINGVIIIFAKNVEKTS